MLHEHWRKMEGIGEQVATAGRVLGVADGRDDLVLALSCAFWAAQGMVGVMAGRTANRVPEFSASAWT